MKSYSEDIRTRSGEVLRGGTVIVPLNHDGDDKCDDDGCSERAVIAPSNYHPCIDENYDDECRSRIVEEAQYGCFCHRQLMDTIAGQVWQGELVEPVLNKK